METAISVENVSKMYPLYDNPRDRLHQSLWELLPKWIAPQSKKFYKEFWALHDISFTVNKKECLGIIGVNGSGKSTILQLLAGILSPTQGKVNINGKATAILELGSGFNPNFTGRENIYINGSILGFSQKEMKERIDDIIAFANIGDFIDQPVKLYSNGMYIRLAFSIQVCLEPEILIIDEVLSVGDIFFQQKCHARIEELMRMNTAIVIVSHNMIDIEKHCSQAILLDNGRINYHGQPNEAVERYFQIGDSHKPISFFGYHKSNNHIEGMDQDKFKPTFDWPDNDCLVDISKATIVGEKDKVKITRITLLNDAEEPCTHFKAGEKAVFYYEFEILDNIEFPVGGLRLTNSKNINIHGKNSLQHFIEAPAFVREGSFLRFRQTIELTIAPGEYTFMVALATFNKNDASLIDNVSDEDIHSKLQVLLRVIQAGSFIVTFKERHFPFYDLTDLKGDCSVSVVTP